MQRSVSKYCALAVVLTVLGAPFAYAADNGSSTAAGKGGSPDCQTQGNQMATGQSCPESKTPAATGNGG